MGDKLVEVMCELCGKPVMVRARARKFGRGRFHKRCAQVARCLGSKNPNYIRGERSYRACRIRPERRALIRDRDGHRCQYCRRPDQTLDPSGVRQLDVHHVIPVGEGGPDDDSNLASLCRRCHNRLEHKRCPPLVWPPPGGLAPIKPPEPPPKVIPMIEPEEVYEIRHEEVFVMPEGF